MEFVKSRFIKSVSLVLLFAIFGTSGAFAQDDGPIKSLETSDPSSLIKPIDPSKLNDLLKPVDSSELDAFLEKYVRPYENEYPYTSSHNREYPLIEDPWPDYINIPIEKGYIEATWEVERIPLPVSEPQFTWSNAHHQVSENIVDEVLDLSNDTDVYIVVFGNFGGASQIFEKYPYDTDFPEWVASAYICNSSFRETLSGNRRHGDQVATFLSQAYTTNCHSDFNPESDRIFSFTSSKINKPR